MARIRWVARIRLVYPNKIAMKNKKNRKYGNRRKAAAFASASSDVTDAIVAEISSYLTANYSGTATKFWKSHELSYPLLSKMAEVYLSVSSGSVPVESLFSTAGYIRA